MTDKVLKIRKEVEKRFEQIKNSERESDSGAFYQLKELLEFIDSLQEETISENLGEFTNELSKQFPEVSFAKVCKIATRTAKWQKKHLWKPACGEDLPKADGWTIVLIECNAPWIAHDEEKPFYSVDLARWSKYIGGWNLPNVKWWMDCSLPNLEED